MTIKIKTTKIKTQRARMWATLTAAYVLWMLTFGTLQGLTGGGWWGFLLWTGLYGCIVAVALVAPRTMRWIEAGEAS